MIARVVAWVGNHVELSILILAGVLFVIDLVVRACADVSLPLMFHTGGVVR